MSTELQKIESDDVAKMSDVVLEDLEGSPIKQKESAYSAKEINMSVNLPRSDSPLPLELEDKTNSA
jgi:hypothetical protein